MEDNHDDIDDIQIIDIVLDDENDQNTYRQPESQSSKEPENISSKEPEDLDSKEPDTGFEEKTSKVNVVREIFSYVMIIALAFVIAVAINRFVIINAHVPSSSMEPTIMKDDKMIGFRLAYLFSEPKAGDIIIFKYPDDETQTYIKRVIGVPGDIVRIVDGTLYVNDMPVEEDYLAETMNGSFGPYEVPEESYFVLGDNRNVSEDARYWENTYVKRNQILAKAWIRYSPSIKRIK